MTSTLVIIGGGQAGPQAVDTLRREGFAGRLVLVSEEQELPYQRPPLSKKYLTGELQADRLPFRHRAFYDQHAVELLLATRAIAIDAEQRAIALSSGERLVYDRLLLCVGAVERRLTCPGSHLSGIYYLRKIGDAAGIREGLQPGARVVIVGGGYIGLETAATA